MRRKKKVDMKSLKEKAEELRKEVLKTLGRKDGQSAYDIYLILREKRNDKYLYEKIAKILKKIAEAGELRREEVESPYSGLKKKFVYYSL